VDKPGVSSVLARILTTESWFLNLEGVTMGKTPLHKLAIARSPSRPYLDTPLLELFCLT